MFKEQLSPYTSLELPCGLNVCEDHPLLYLLQWEISSYLTFLPDNSIPPLPSTREPNRWGCHDDSQERLTGWSN